MELTNNEEVINIIKKTIEIDFKRINDLILKLKPENDEKLFERNIFNIYISFYKSETLQYIKMLYPNFHENDDLNSIKNKKDEENNKIISLDNENLNIENIINEENVNKINLSKLNLKNENFDYSNKKNTETSNFNILNDKSYNNSFQNKDNINYQNLYSGKKDKNKLTDDEINKIQEKEEKLEIFEIKEKIIALLTKYPNIKNKYAKFLKIQISDLNNKIKEINDIEYLDNILNSINLLIDLK